MTKKLNPNQTGDAYPSNINSDRIRNSNDRDTGTCQQHERDLAKLDRAHSPQKGGRGRDK